MTSNPTHPSAKSFKPLVAPARRMSIPALLVLCAMGCGGSDAHYCNDADTDGHLGPNVVYDLPSARSVLQVSPAQMPEVIRNRYRLKPDRRFLLAIAEVDCLMSGQAPGELRVAFRDGEWVIRYGGELVGALPEIPDFVDATALLGEWIQNLARRHPVEFREDLRAADTAFVRAELDQFEVANIADALRRIEERWNNSGPQREFLALAASALVRLNVQRLDWLEIEDRLPAKALAVTMLAKTLTPHDLAGEESLLAYEMGYTTHAERVAASLPERDAVRPYVTRNTEKLQALAQAKGADRLTRYLYLMRLSETRDDNAWRRWQRTYGFRPRGSLGALKTELSLRSYGAGLYPPDAVSRSAIGELWRATDGGPYLFRLVNSFRRFVARMVALGAAAGESDLASELPMYVFVPAAGLIPRFEEAAAELQEEYRGPFLDAETYRSYFSGHFYSAIHQKALHLLDRQAHVPSAEELLETLEGVPPGTGAELFRWYSHLTASEAGRGNVEDLRADLAELRLGQTPLNRTLNQLREHLDQEEFVSAAAQYVRRLDTRPDHQSSVASTAGPNLFDLKTSDKYYRSLLDMASSDYGRTALWMARYDGDYRAVLDGVVDQRQEPGIRKRALELIIEADLADKAAIRRSARALINDHPSDWSIRRMFIDFLEEEGDYREALPVIEDWLSRHDRGDGFDYIYARTAMARFHHHLGDYETALKYVGPVVDSWQAGAIGRAAIVLGALGRLDEARELADRLVRRYPGSAWGRSVLAEILWRQGLQDEVAPVLRPEGYTIWAPDWREHVARAFLAVFADKPVEEAQAAFAALLASGVPAWRADDIAAGAYDAARPDLAFVLQAMLPIARSRNGIDQQLLGYRYLKASQGNHEAALRWLRSRIPTNLLNAAALEIFSLGEDELLWELVTRPEGRQYGENVWLLRAAAFVRSGKLAAPRRRALYARYERGSGDAYFMMGRYLLGLESEETTLALATTPQRRCEVAFYMGVKAQGEGRYEDAHDWYLAVRETRQMRDYEYGWATFMLDEWDDRDRSLAVLAREGRR